MAQAQMMLHADEKKGGAAPISRDALANLPDPEVLGSRHRPIRFNRLVEAIQMEADARGLFVMKEQYAITRDNGRLFGTMDLGIREGSEAPIPGEGTGMAIGFRSASDQSFTLQMVAGNRVFVCDNLALSGDVMALKRKHTIGLELEEVMAGTFDRLLEHSGKLIRSVETLQAHEISDIQARSVIYRALVEKVIPLKLFHDVHAAYFGPGIEDRPDCAPRTAWGLHNAFTRAIKGLGVAPGWEANVGLGRLLGLRSGREDN